MIPLMVMARVRKCARGVISPVPRMANTRCCAPIRSYFF